MLAELARAVRERRVSPVELVEESLRRIERVDPPLNAVVRVHAEEALAAARVMADGDDAGRSGPLAGIPLLVKDMARCAGSVTTFGSPMYADAPPDTVDDATVGKLRAAGAIAVGRTNTPAFGHTAFTDNKVFGPTRNPWNLERSPAGSSGGSAAALIAGIAPLATTSDGGGSTRGPASACGLVGYKPTNGAYGRNVLPRWIAFSTMGTAGRSVADVAYEAAVSIGGVPGDVLSFPRAAVDLASRRPSRVVAVPGFRGGMDTVVAEAFDRACSVVEREIGLPVARVERVFSGDTATAWFTISAAELAQSLADVREQWTEFEPSLQLTCEYGAAVTAFDYVAAQRARFTAAAELDALLRDDAVLVVPTFNSESWPAEGPLPVAAGPVSGPGVAFNTTEGNFTGHPGISVPMGHDTAGVPFGLQVVAPRFADGLAFGLAEALEAAMPWATTAPGYDPWPMP